MSTVRSGRLAVGTLSLLTVLYFAQGLPYGFFSQAVPVILREEGYSLTQISVYGLLFAPWGLKFLWAPYVDAYGTRRRWLVSLQLSSAVVALVLATLDLSGSLVWLLIGIAVINLLSATQDIATDGLAVSMLEPRQRGLGNGIQVGAYRIGMIAGGGGLLWLFSFAGWRALFVVMAVLLFAVTVGVWFLAREPSRPTGDAPPTPSKRVSPGLLLTGWSSRLRRPGVIAFILVVGAFKFGNSMASALVGPFMSDIGLTLGQIALVEGVLSSAGALGGAALGGWLAYTYGRRHALLVGGVTQTLSLGLYLVASIGVGGFSLVVTASLAEHILGGAATVAVFTLMMDACQKGYEGSDYTLFACAVVGVQGAAGFAAGIVGDLFGFPAIFASGLILSGLGCLVMIRALDRGLMKRLG
ncbi:MULTISPECIES: MFS transporter [unclassified Gordonia (in: high G+C Gram-positive bacteria)]|uniref:MFS transporter n=1 Tax=unclassified Gordonia (in: high G+C Gram-positive bacteria) TaxID=2657482 RepID=UPI00071E5E2D|nr:MULTISPECIES: MFS transporter [unclassified Gordonia (in: high G+C Gram-positive bacteria)]KSU57128.1 MFS transporter [Gordonia sp. SGD-V-85]SCC40850.1 Major Facilitator Superfamily protein [Gordonia sp. v-85]